MALSGRMKLELRLPHIELRLDLARNAHFGVGAASLQASRQEKVGAQTLIRDLDSAESRLVDGSELTCYLLSIGFLLLVIGYLT